MAKPAIRKPKKKVCLFCQDKICGWTTRTPGCFGSSSPIAARSVPAGCRAIAPSTSVTWRPLSRTHARWRCFRTRARRAEARRCNDERFADEAHSHQEVSGLGAPGDIVEVEGGYGRNYLVPRGFAMRWSRGGEKQIDLIKRARAAREIRSVDDAKAAAERLAGLRRSGCRPGPASGGRLFGSITTSDIATAVKTAGGPELDRRKIEIATRSRPRRAPGRGASCTPRSARPSRSRSSAPTRRPIRETAASRGQAS